MHNSNGWENSMLAIQHAVAELAGLQFEDNDADPPEDGGGGRTVWVEVHTGLGGYRRYSVLTKGNNIDDDKHAGGGGGDRSCAAWMAELRSSSRGRAWGNADPPIMAFSRGTMQRGVSSMAMCCVCPRDP